jgi:cysteine-rich repeat protein
MSKVFLRAKCELPCVPVLALIILILISFGQSVVFADNPPERCAGYGDLQSMSLTVWEAGLGSWTVGTRNTAVNFDTPNWAVVANLPDSRSGLAAFVADQDNGDCVTENKSGVLTLDSPTIVIPGGTQIPRISIEHWFDIEYGWDGGNLKISVNGDAFNLVPASAIEFGPYTSTLFPPSKDSAPYNTNPLANQEAYTGTNGGQPTGSWGHTYINLVGIAGAGDTVKLRFDFGIDQCGGNVGWYVDEVEFYSCSAELLPSDCGNGIIDAGEQCDDGNDFIEDGCSNTCQIEEGWQCTAPTLPSDVPDHSFEAGTPNPFWTEVSNNPIGTPICRASVCGTGGGSGPSDGLYWLWFGGTKQYQEGSVAQDIVIPSTEKYLSFDLEIPTCDSPSDYVEVLIDGVQAWVIDGSSPLCGVDGYSRQSLDLGPKADGASHEIKFPSESFGVNDSVSSFFIDVVEIPGVASLCTLDSGAIFRNGFE